MSTKELTRRQARWSLELSEYDFSLPIGLENLMDGRMHTLPTKSDHHLENECSNFKRILDPKRSSICSPLISDMDLHVIVHSEGPTKIFVLRIRLATIIADFLAGEEDSSEWTTFQKSLWRSAEGAEELSFSGRHFLRILEDGSLRPLMFIMSSDQRLFGITTNLWRISSMGR
ncbi:hypothetical protein BASA83_010534 [Batrachochytrium salamandrivorans]|nr:hypothetical protein BASA83_010534 [Batrachochytrium salamandrivorans]